jgi:hypothetical protein
MHRSARHCTKIPGIEAISIISDRIFPRHTHDKFGIGYLVDGGQESWSGRGHVEARKGDIITVTRRNLVDLSILRPAPALVYELLTSFGSAN